LGGERVVVIHVERGHVLLATCVLALLVLAAFTVYYDYSSSYVWVFPLDTARDVYTFFKPRVVVGVYSVVDTHRSFVVFNGAAGVIRVASSGDYAVVSASGASTYVVAVASLAVILYALTSRRLWRATAGRGLQGALLLVALLALFTTPITALYFHVNSGFEYSFSFTEEPVKVVYFKDLKYAVVDVDGAKPMYLTSGSLNITVVSTAPLENTTLIYYKASFRELATSVPLHVILAPGLMLVASTAVGLGFTRVLVKKAER